MWGQNIGFLMFEQVVRIVTTDLETVKLLS
jgi:hypothetical protein